MDKLQLKLSNLFYNCAHTVKYKTVGHDVNYAFVEERDILYIYFQGSESVTDWIRNFLFGKRPYKDMAIPYRVHRGFLAAWKEVEDIVIEKIQEKRKKRFYNSFEDSYYFKQVYRWKKIIVVGYSHGGALAAFCHECVWFWRPDLREDGLVGYGFEAPRMYAEYRVKPELRERWKTFTVIRTNNDLVTHCPPAIFKYHHVGHILKVKGDTSLVKKWYIPKCIKSHFPEVVYDALIKAENKKK